MARCLGCMNEYGDEFEMCPHCGYIKGTGAEEAIHMTPGSIIGGRYLIGKVLGYGGFGVTYIGWDQKLEQKVAIKEYLPSEFATRMPGKTQVTIFSGVKSVQFQDGLQKFVDEAKRLAKFQNESGIVKIFDSFIENDTAYIVMEYLEGETLADLLKREGTVSEYDAIDMLRPVMMSLKTVHEAGILHRDIAPDNIFITNGGDIKLIDFGASRYATTSHSRSLTVIIKPGYSPEEQYRSRGDQGPWTDVYALGGCLYKMITGKTPPDAMERRAKFEIQNKDILVRPSKAGKRIKISVIHENAILNAMNVRIEDRTPDVGTLMEELSSDTLVKRLNGRIKKVDVYRWPIWFKVCTALIVLAILSTGVLMATGIIRVDSLFSDTVVVPDGMVAVPDVTDMTIEKATKRIESSKLEVAITGNITSPYVEAGKIVMQDPVSGMFCEEQAIVSLYLSRGTGEITQASDGKATVPYILGLAEEEAVESLKAAGLGAPDIAYEYDETFAAGLVMKQSKDYGSTVDEGTSISIVISLGTKPVEVPNVKGMTYDEAQKQLTAIGLVVTREQKATGKQAVGTIVSQSISAGETVQKGTTVVLYVAEESKWTDCDTLPDTVKNNSEKYEIETFYEYRYRNTVTVTNQNEAKSDWELISKEQYDTGKYTEFTEWSSDNNTGDIVEERTVYTYKVTEKCWESSSTLTGWSATGNVKYSEWGANQTTTAKPTEGDTLQIIDQSTVYSYHHYDAYAPEYGTASGYYCFEDGSRGGTRHEHTSNTALSFNGSYYTGPACPYGWIAWWSDGETTTYTYQTRSVSSYEFTRTSDEKYSETYPSEAGAESIEAHKEYRSKSKVYETKYIYWGSYSSWQEGEVSENSTTQVESRVSGYRYKEK